MNDVRVDVGSVWFTKIKICGSSAVNRRTGIPCPALPALHRTECEL